MTEAFDSCCYIDEGENLIIVFEDTDTKWYDSYPDVQALEALYAAFDDEGMFTCAFTRVGEDTGDIEIRQSGDCSYELQSTSTIINSQYTFDLNMRLKT